MSKLELDAFLDLCKTNQKRAKKLSGHILKRHFDEARATKRWDIIKVICDMDSINKPIEASKEQVLLAAIEAEAWDDVFAIEQAFKGEENYLTAGPLQKSDETRQLEDIARALMRMDAYTITKEDDHCFISFEDRLDGTILPKYDLTKIIERCNFEHIDFSEPDFNLYKIYMDRHEYPDEAEAYLSPEYENLYRDALFQYHDEPVSSKSLITFQEMQSINIYSGFRFYKDMNQVLRGSFEFNEYPIYSRAVIIQSVMCASALRKIPEVIVPFAYRGFDFNSDKERLEHIRAAATKGVVTLSGFVSTSVQAQCSRVTTASAMYRFENLKGVYIAPISKTAMEAEFLMPPTQIQLTGYKREDGKDYFTASPVTDLGNTQIEVLRTSCCKILNEIQSHQFGPNDNIMINFFQQKQNEIRNASEIDALNIIKNGLVVRLNAMKNDKIINVIRTAIQSIRDSAGIFNFWAHVKANRIERALCNVPIEERGAVCGMDDLSNNLTDAAIKTELSLHPPGLTSSVKEFKKRLYEAKMTDKEDLGPGQSILVNSKKH